MNARFAGRKNIGPFRVNFGKNGLTSVSVKFGPLTTRVWSRTEGAQFDPTSLDTPGFGSIRL